MTPDEYEEVLSGSGGQFEILERRPRWQLLQLWREVYAAQVHEATGSWKLGQFEWHIFNTNYVRSLRGGRAVMAYLEQHAQTVIVCPEEPSLPAVRLTHGRRPSFPGYDVYIWPEDLAWTMAFTHEESMGLGPYFSRRDWMAGE